MNRDVSGQICPSCDTGKKTYLLDPKEPFCPYLNHNKGNFCNMYVPLIKTEQLISKIHKEEFSNEN